MPTNEQIHDDRRGVRRAKKKLASRQSTFDALRNQAGRTRPGSMKVRPN